MFVCTILHSLDLDHSLMDWNLKDPLWLDVDNPRFGKMAEVGRVVNDGFVSDVPALYFLKRKRYKGRGHPFYEAVYRRQPRSTRSLLITLTLASLNNCAAFMLGCQNLKDQYGLRQLKEHSLLIRLCS